MNKYYEEQFNNIKAYIERVERDNKCLHNKIERLNNIINKAIEYLEDNTSYSVLSGMIEFYGSTDEVIDILKGKENEEN